MKKHFTDLFKHNNWANQRILDLIDENGSEDERILRIYSHIISTQMVWLLRIRGLPTSPFPLWEIYKPSELQSMTEESSRNWVDLLQRHKLDTFEEMIFYRDTKGVKHESTIRQIINQVLSHSSYHRGQIASIFRELQIDPPVTDYIAYRRLL